MPRLTKTDIEQTLKSGKPLSWKDVSNKSSSIVLDTAKQRRLWDYLLKSKIRDVKGLSAAFTDGLAAAFIAPTDPAADTVAVLTRGTVVLSSGALTEKVSWLKDLTGVGSHLLRQRLYGR
jgi:hypothetical protein